MGQNLVLIAINKGGVTVDKKILFNVDEHDFIEEKKKFEKWNFEHFVMFLTEQELNSIMNEMDKRRSGSI